MNETVFTVQEIVDLAKFAGLTLDETRLPDKDELEATITVGPCPEKGIHAVGEPPKRYVKIAWFEEYPEEGCVGLGPELP